MDQNINHRNKNIRKIEDIIDIQKANGNFNTSRQVAFKLPLETESAVSAGLARSLESGLSKSKSDNLQNKKFKKVRPKRQKSPLPDVISWPSDSDITVLRMKLCLNSSGLQDKVGNVILGDGLHQPDSSSMVNLATLIRQSQTASKHSLNIEEYLLPLTSWERESENQDANKKSIDVKEKPSVSVCSQFNREFHTYEAMCSHHTIEENLGSKDSGIYSKPNTKSKLAKFLRLYFCPCCTCLYKLETMREDPSVYFTKRKDIN